MCVFVCFGSWGLWSKGLASLWAFRMVFLSMLVLRVSSSGFGCVGIYTVFSGLCGYVSRGLEGVGVRVWGLGFSV